MRNIVICLHTEKIQMMAINILKGMCFGAFTGVLSCAIISPMFIQDVGYLFWMGDPSDFIVYFGKTMIATAMLLGGFLNLISSGRVCD